MTSYELNFKKLTKIIDLEALKKEEYLLYSSRGFMDLHANFLREEKDGRYILSLAHNYEQNGDLVNDPDVEIRVDERYHTVEALTYQDALTYNEVYFEKDGEVLVNLQLKRSLNQFLSKWLTNLSNQGFTRASQASEVKEMNAK